MSANVSIENRRNNRPASASALYLHVPFCRSKCRYCDFYSTTIDGDSAASYVHAATIELARKLPQLTFPLKSVFVGGGTPTALPIDLLEMLLSPVGAIIDESTEFTVEANPATLGDGEAEMLARIGVNRLSIGAQSFQSDELAVLGRIHNAEQIRAAREAARTAGISNISLDLIYGVPAQTLASWRNSLAEALALDIDHLSCYALSIEHGTPLELDVSSGRIKQVDESLQLDQYNATVADLSDAGLGRYEISNFARPGRECRHNLTYWRNEPYVGIGPAAASYDGAIRSKNISDTDSYVQALESGLFAPSESEQLVQRVAMSETIMLALRMTQGLDRSSFARRFGLDPLEAFPESLTRYRRQGALVITDDRITLADEAFFVSDTILADILAEA